MFGKELLVDTVNIRLQMQEGADGGKLIARGEFARGDVPTANKRVYPTKLWQREVNRLNESMKARKVFGELDHPEDGKTKLSRAAHMVVNLGVDKNGIVIGEAEVMDTDAGRNLKAILEAGGTIGISSRGYGSVKLSEDGSSNIVQDDYQLMTFDFVADPAQSTAYPEFSASESNNKEGAVIETNVDPVEAAVIQETTAVVEPVVEPIVAVELKPEEVVSAVEETPEVIAQESTEPMISVKDHEAAMAALQSDFTSKLAQELGAVGTENEKVSADVKAENVELLKICRDLGFNLYLERTLSKHPKYKEILESLDYEKFDSLADIKRAVAPYISEVEPLMQAESKKYSEGIIALEQQVGTLKAESEALRSKLEIAESEKDFAVKLGLESASRAYLERKIVGNQSASLIRQKFEGLESKTKTHVDALVEAYNVTVASTRESLHESVRRRFKGGASVTTESKDMVRDVRPLAGQMVEKSLNGTVLVQEGHENNVRLTEDFTMNLKEFNALSGTVKQNPKH